MKIIAIIIKQYEYLTPNFSRNIEYDLSRCHDFILYGKICIQV